MQSIKKETATVKHGDAPDETRAFPAHGHADFFQLGHVAAMRATFEPGWCWSKDLAATAGTRSCQHPHLGYVLSGCMHVKMDDGAEIEFGPGDFFDIPPGHDGWVVGDEACTLLDFAGDPRFAAAPKSTMRQREETEASFRH